MAKFSEVFASLEQKGRDYMQAERHRQRAAYMASKIAGRMTEWRPIDDIAFDAINNMVTALAIEAGFMPAPPQSMPASPPPNLQQPAVNKPPAPLLPPGTIKRAPITEDDEKRLASAVGSPGGSYG